MLTLLLLRHAKSSWDDINTEDHDRPLAERGLLAAPLMGGYIAREDLAPAMVLCSTSARTRATLDLVLTKLKTEPETVFEQELYLAEADTLLARLRRVPARVKRVMMIGHNPGFEDFARLLAGSGDATSLHLIANKFPTAGLAVITFDAKSWRSIEPGGGHLDRFITPRMLQRGEVGA